MSELVLGLIISVIGIVVTILTLYILMLLIGLLSRLYPYKEKAEKKA